MKRYLILFLSMLLFCTAVSSLEVPALKGRVNDYANRLTSSEVQKLESEIKSLESTSSSQIAILIINSLEGDSLEDFSYRTADEWGMGQKGYDNGVLIVVSQGDRSIRIDAGYGLEATLTDASSSYIIRNIISPNFQSGDTYQGLSQGVEAIAGIISGEYQITQTQSSQSNSSSRSSGRSPFSLIFIVLFLIISTIGRSGRRGRRGRGLGTFLILNSILGGSSRSSGSGFSSGTGFSGGGFGGGGGFSGGGGGFGGGGASGGW